MKNNEQVNYKPNSCKPVYKFNTKGELVYTYERITDAIHQEHVSHSRMSELLCSGNPLRGHIFSRSMNMDRSEGAYQPSFNDQMPWEADNGMFDISGWGKCCF